VALDNKKKAKVTQKKQLKIWLKVSGKFASQIEISINVFDKDGKKLISCQLISEKSSHPLIRGNR
jgi:hypothetical protein